MSNINGIFPSYFPPVFNETFEYLETTTAGIVKSATDYFETAQTDFVEFFEWAGNWISSGFKSTEPGPYELTPEQKATIEKIYYETLNVLRELDQPGAKEEVRNFLQHLRAYYAKRTEQIEKQSKLHYDSYEFSRKRVQKHRDEEHAEYEAMLRDAAASNIFQRLTRAAAPIYIMIGSLSLPPGLNAALFTIGLILAVEELSDHALTKFMAELIAQGDKEFEDQLNFRLQMASSIISLAISLPLSFDGFSLVMVIAAAKAGTGAGGTFSEMMKGSREGKLTQIKHDAETWDRKILEAAKRLSDENRAEQDLNEKTLNMIDAQHQVISKMFGG